MKTLITADLHHRRDWYNWLLQQAHTIDAIAIAGDLLDMSVDVTPQIAFVTHWAQRMSYTGTLLSCATAITITTERVFPIPHSEQPPSQLI